MSPGEVIALVGPSGGGKSSCINLIEHFYEPTTGQVLLDGRNVGDYDHKYLHSKVSPEIIDEGRRVTNLFQENKHAYGDNGVLAFKGFI